MSKIIRSPEKQMQYQKKHRIFSALIFGGTFLFVVLIAWVPSLEPFQIKDIVVEGNKVLAKEEIGESVRENISGKYFYVFPRTNIFFYPKNETEEHLRASFPRILKISLNLDSDRRLTVSVLEREPFALWCGREIFEEKTDESCAYLDEGGFVFAKAPRFSGNAYFEFYGKGILPERDSVGYNFLPGTVFQNIVKIKEKLESFGMRPIKIFVAEDGRAEFTEISGYGIRFNIDQDVSFLASNMQAVFRSRSWGGTSASDPLEYIDFRFGNKVYYKYKNQKENSEVMEKNQE